MTRGQASGSRARSRRFGAVAEHFAVERIGEVNPRT